MPETPNPDAAPESIDATHQSETVTGLRGVFLGTFSDVRGMQGMLRTGLRLYLLSLTILLASHVLQLLVFWTLGIILGVFIFTGWAELSAHLVAIASCMFLVRSRFHFTLTVWMLCLSILVLASNFWPAFSTSPVEGLVRFGVIQSIGLVFQVIGLMLCIRISPNTLNLRAWMAITGKILLTIIQMTVYFASSPDSTWSPFQFKFAIGIATCLWLSINLLEIHVVYLCLTRQVSASPERPASIE